MSRKYLALVRREFQEHRSLWLAPSAVAGLLLLVLLWRGTGPGGAIGMSSMPGQAMAQLGTMSLVTTGMVLNAVAALAVLAYLLDCLFAERRDRSILFWKSLPVSDTETVLAKLVVASVLVPLGVMLLTLLLQPLLTLITYVRYEGMRPMIGLATVAGWPEGMARLGASWLFGLLWYFPFATYLMLASLLARRAPIVYAALPLLVLAMLEGLMFSGSQVRSFIWDRLNPWDVHLGLLLDVNGRSGQWWRAFQAPALWLGVVAGAGMLYAVIRLRRYRDDT